MSFKVDFMIIGAQKCATTTLSNLLANHEGINFSRIKEPNFWCKNVFSDSDIDNYHALFSSDSTKLSGEGSTSYTLFPYYNPNSQTSYSVFRSDMLLYELNSLNVAEQIYNYNPNTKFIYVIRDPLERIVSHYKHFKERGYFKGDINSSVLYERSLIDFSRYYTQLLPFIKFFGKDSILIVDFEDLKYKNKSCLDKISQFLNIDVALFNESDFQVTNASGVRRLHYKFDKFPSILKKIIKKTPKSKSRANLKLSDESVKIIMQSLCTEFTLLEQEFPKYFPEWGKNYLK